MVYRGSEINRRGAANRPRLISTRVRFWILLGIIVVILLMFLFGGDGLWHSFVLKRQIDVMETKIDSLETVNAQMKQRIEGLRSRDPDVIEEEARSQGMIKPGEKVYLMRHKSEKSK